MAKAKVLLVTCSECGSDCLGESMAKVRLADVPKRYRELSRIVVRVKDRPRCKACVDEAWREMMIEKREWEKTVYRVVEG